MDRDTGRGLYRKYDVRRLNDPEGKHTQCNYFVLDLDHDPYAKVALRAYAVSCRQKFPQLSDDLTQIANGNPLTPIKASING